MTIAGRRIVVTGATGLLGRRIVEALSSTANVFGTYHSTPPDSTASRFGKYLHTDLAISSAVASLVRDADPDTVINCAALADVDRCETEPREAEAANVEILRNLISAADSSRLTIVQISTDYIFDGKDGRYSEESIPNPINVYGATKLAAERLLSGWPGKWLIVRTSALFDNYRAGKSNLFTSAYDRLRAGDAVVAAEDLFCSPVSCVNLAHAIAECIANGTQGVLNIAGSEYMSRYEFALQLADAFGYDESLVRPVLVEALHRPARRPLNAGLDIAKARNVLSTMFLSPLEVFSTWRAAVSD